MQTSVNSNVVHHMSVRFPFPMERMNNKNNQDKHMSVVQDVETVDLRSNNSNAMVHQHYPMIQSMQHNNVNNYSAFLTELRKQQFVQQNDNRNEQRKVANEGTLDRTKIIRSLEISPPKKEITTLPNTNIAKKRKQMDDEKKSSISMSSDKNNDYPKSEITKRGTARDDSEHCILELPLTAKSGDRLVFVWPSKENETQEKANKLLSAQTSLAVIVPSCFPEPGVVRKDPKSGDEIPERRFIRVVSPDGPAPEMTAKMSTYAQMSVKLRSTRKTNKSTPNVINDAKNKEWNTDTEMNIRWKEYKKDSSRIGKNYQATEIPKCGTYDEERKTIKDDDMDEFETLWNPQKARCAIYHGQNVTKFIESLPTNQKYLGLESLHRQKYNTEDAEKILKAHIQTKGPEVQGDSLSAEDIIKFDLSIRKHQKNFLKIANDISKSVATTLVHYYKNVKPSSNYRNLRLFFHSELDECQICGEGGNLICCDTCASPYHLGCVDLVEVPTGNWFCPKCIRKGKNKL